MLISKDVPLDWSEKRSPVFGVNSLLQPIKFPDIFLGPILKTQLNIGVYPQLGRFQLSKNKKIPVKFPV